MDESLNQPSSVQAFNVKYPTEYIQRPEKWQANQTAFAAFYEAL